MTRGRANEIADDMLSLYLETPWFIDAQPVKDDGGMHIELTVTSLSDMLDWGTSRKDFEHYGIRICLIQQKESFASA